MINLRTFQLKINGSSMKPLLNDQDEVEVLCFDTPMQVSELAIGKVVLLKQSKEWVIHRVLQDEQILKTKGDWSMHFDEIGSVWGEVISINGKKNHLLNSKKMSHLSKGINAKNNQVIRKWNRLKLMFFVMTMKLKKWFQ